MREPNRTGRFTLALTAALLAGLLTAWVEPTTRPHDELRHQIAEVAREVRGLLPPAAIVLDQPLPLARTMVSNSQ